MSTIITNSNVVALVAAGVNLSEMFPGGFTVVPDGAAVPPAVSQPKADRKQPESLVAAKRHCYEARMARRANTKLGGLTKAERSALYAAHPELSTMSATARRKAWNDIVAEFKAAN